MKLAAIFTFPLLCAIQIYRYFISPLKTSLFGATSGCRFTPSCSQYAEESLKLHGPACGSLLALKRLLRCHPWSECGYDPVPEPRKHSQKSTASRGSCCERLPVTPSTAHCPRT